MNNNLQDNNVNIFSQDEISITDLIMKLWQRRGLIVTLPIISLLLAVIFLFATAVKTQPPTIFFVQLKGIKDGTYPNGSSFSPQDLLISEVLTKAAAQLDLQVNEDLREAIQVEYGAPTTAGIKRMYQEKLADKKLTAVDIEAINKAYQDELQKVSESSLRITVDHAALGVSPAQGAVLANALPRAWTDVYTRKYRVLVDTRLRNVAVAATENELRTTSDILAARSTLDRVRSGLKLLSEDNRLKAITSNGGFNSADLQSQLQNFNELYFRPIFSSLFVDPDLIAKSFKTEISLKLIELDANIEELNRTLDDLKNFHSQTSLNSSTGTAGDTIQLNDSSLSQVVELANRAALSEYLHQVLTSRRELIEKKAALQLELSRANGNGQMACSEDFTQSASQLFSLLTGEYVSLLEKARKIRSQAYGDFFQPIGTPEVLGSSLPPKSKLILVLSAMLGGVFSILFALVLPVRKASDNLDRP